MAKRLQHRGGTTSQHSSFTGAVREITVDTDKNTLVVHDGATAGGHPLATTTNFTSTGIDDNATSTAITIDSSENVGIANTIPGSFNSSANQLVVGSGSGQNGITIYSGTSNNGSIHFGDGTGASSYRGSINYYHNGDTLGFNVGASERMRLTSTGLGIGTTSPAEKLHVSSGGSADIQISPGANQCSIIMTNAGATDYRIRSDNSPDGLIFGTSSIDAMTIDSSGNVGIGTSSPTPPTAYGGLHINSQYPVLKLSSTTSGTGVADGFTVRINSTDDAQLWHYENKNMSFATNNAERMRIDSSGNVGIGTSSPLATLHLEDEVADNSEEASFILGRSKKYSGFVSNVTASTGTIIFQISSTNSNYRSALCKLNLHSRTGAVGGLANHPSAVYYFTLATGFGATANFSTPTLTAVYENVFDKTTDFAFSSTTNNKTCTLTFTNPINQLVGSIYYTLEMIGERFNLDSVTKT